MKPNVYMIWPIRYQILSLSHHQRFLKAEPKKGWKLWERWFPQNKKLPSESEKISIHISQRFLILWIGTHSFISVQQTQTLNFKESELDKRQILFHQSNCNKLEGQFYQKRSANRFRRNQLHTNLLLRKWTTELSGFSLQHRVRALNQQEPFRTM